MALAARCSILHTLKQQLKILPRAVHRCLPKTTSKSSYHSFALHPATNGPLSVQIQRLQPIRLKSGKKGSGYDSDSDSELQNESEYADEKHQKVLTVFVTSLRTDLIVKKGLAISRNRVETLFYEGKIRVNGQVPTKKSARVDVDDEVDVIKQRSVANSDHLVVARLEIVGIKAQEDQIKVTLRRFKSILVPDYEEAPFKADSETQ